MQRNARPIRAVIQFVAQLIKRLFQQEQLQQAAQGLRCRIQVRTAHSCLVGCEEHTPNLCLPCSHVRLQRPQVLRSLRANLRERRISGVIERSQHAGHVPQWRVFLAALGDRTRRLTLKIDKHEVVLGEQHLPKMKIAVVAYLDRLHRFPGNGYETFRDGTTPFKQLVDSVSHRLGQNIAPMLQASQRRLHLRMHPLIPGCEIGCDNRLRIESRIAGSQGQGFVQLPGTLAQRTHQHQIGAMRLLWRPRGNRSHATLFEETLQVTCRVAPAIALVFDIALKQCQRHGFSVIGDILHCSCHRHRIGKFRHFGEKTPHFQFRIRPHLQVPVAFQK